MSEEKKAKYLDTSFSFEERVEDLVSRMTLREKMAQLRFKAPAIHRLGIPEYNWWNECLHGVAKAGIATVFPQAIGLAATFNQDLLFKIADAISTEARAKHHFEHIPKNDRSKGRGLTFWSPNINIFRDPRWGRGQETYGECPYLSGRMGVAFVKGLQGNDPKYVKVIATPKHYAVHSGTEKDRHRMNISVNKKDLFETYLPHFKECIKEANAQSVMCAYNRVNDKPACASSFLQEEILRKKWGFDGYIVSDCGAIADFNRPLGHKYTNRFHKSAAEAIKNGCDLNCGMTYRWLPIAYKKGLISEDDINKSVRRLFLARMKLGMFDPSKLCKYQTIPLEKNDCLEHRMLALEAAKQSIILLKNQNTFLPLSKDLKSIAVIGPNANDWKVLLGSYHGMFSKYISPLGGIKNKIGITAKIRYAQGCKMNNRSPKSFQEAINIAKKSEIVIMILGLSQRYESEEKHSFRFDDDRKFLDLPKPQQKLLHEIYNVNKNIVLVLLNGSPISINWAQDNIPAIIEAWYPGEEAGTALADVLFGDYSPAGRLPVTFPKSEKDLPPILNYNMKGRTYRYSKKEPLYPFGYGLSYSNFEYSNLQLNKNEINAGESLEIKVDVINSGNRLSDEVIQLYLKDMEASIRVPIYDLRGFKRITLNPAEQKTVSFTLTPRNMALINNQGKAILEPGNFKVYIGGRQPDRRSEELSNSIILETQFKVIGKKTELEY
ncbi:MAG: glycoside hydrolase family 3 C-terminal domain-containing protein [Promethearchaeota archaeon]